ncbi:hypothetical protein D3C83_95490 [compost metagenome]
MRLQHVGALVVGLGVDAREFSLAGDAHAHLHRRDEYLGVGHVHRQRDLQPRIGIGDVVAALGFDRHRLAEHGRELA